MIVFFIFTPISLSVFAKPGPVLVQSSDAELHCEITGSPDTKVQWQGPGGQESIIKKTSNSPETCDFKRIRPVDVSGHGWL